MIQIYTPQVNLCSNELSYLTTLLSKVTKQFLNSPYGIDEGETNYKSRYHLAVLLDRTLTQLNMHKDHSLNEPIQQFLSKCGMNLSDEGEKEFFTSYRVLSSEPVAATWDVRIPFEKQLLRLLGPINMHTLTGFLGVGKTSLVRQVVDYDSTDGNYYLLLQSKEVHANQRIPVAIAMNDATGFFDAKRLKAKALHSSSDLESDEQKSPQLIFFMSDPEFKKMESTLSRQGLTLKEHVLNPLDKQATSESGNMTQVAGCICCKDREIHAGNLSNYNRGNIGGADGSHISAILTEPTGIADGKGIENTAFIPMGRLFHHQLLTMIDPSVPRWQRLLEISKQSASLFPDKTIDELTDNEKRITLKMEGMDCVYLNQLTHSTHIILNSRGSSDLLHAGDIRPLLNFGGAHPHVKITTQNLLSQPLSGLPLYAECTPMSIDSIEPDYDLVGELVMMGLFAKSFEVRAKKSQSFNHEDYLQTLYRHRNSIERCKGYILTQDKRKVEIHISSDHTMTVNGIPYTGN